MLIDILKFNRDRGLLDYVVNNDLEKKMLNEEWQEFIESETLAGRIDACIDFDYVLKGTMFKTLNKEAKSFEDTYLKKVSDERLTIMVECLREEMGVEKFSEIMSKATELVHKINATKPHKIKDGKVTKQKDIRDATKEIADMAELVLNPTEPQAD